ncbi:hypothetical protein SARC_12645 [Sphaeroforma arctica JP610]|uniref:Uncharacterized protein n=1 Tax=Sphaeroforma arctica JP610 TaxID=667725 RepID=A0A0L0FDH9_9EUKA|nr:hypothetical protein SARC_12645 [Sphaeroforma arctica JP610]KNC74815.1 hypothetical protein SARC_12645 [Sphaeroforma arctica JP610]|eukprot:XP_014148717.1 hypothetical protein SARC_12645 [Sphaeroforma arctica JP610]
MKSGLFHVLSYFDKYLFVQYYSNKKRSGSDPATPDLRSPSHNQGSHSPVGRQRSLENWQGISPEEALSHVVLAARQYIQKDLEKCKTLKVHLFYAESEVWVDVDLSSTNPDQFDLGIIDDKVLYMKLARIHKETTKACKRLAVVVQRVQSQNKKTLSGMPMMSFISENSIVGAKHTFLVYGFQIKVEVGVLNG